MKPIRARRRGVSLLELQVAMIVLGVAVSGLCPLVVMQARLVRKLETQAVGPDNPQVIRGVRMLDGAAFSGQGLAAAPPTTVLQPQPDAWVRRLGVPASFAVNAPAQPFTALPVQTTLDDSNPGFSASGWSTAADASANNGGYRKLAADSPNGPATWTFTGLVPGRYRVMASWVANAQNSRGATYSFTDGGGDAVAVPVDQTTVPGGSPPYWTELGVYYLDATFQVSLAGSISGSVVADGIQLIPAGARNSVTITTPAATTSDGATVRARVTGS